MDDKERKKAEIRARLEAQMQASKKKKGFMTPERKKRLRLLLRKKAADELKRQQEAKAEERRRVIGERTGKPRPIEDANEDTLMKICQEYHKRITKLNEDKWELEWVTAKKEFEIMDLSAKVNDMRGRFIIPPLRKVSKAAAQAEKMRQWSYKLAKLDMRNNLKQVKKEVVLDVKDKLPKGDKPQWLAKEDGKQQDKTRGKSQEPKKEVKEDIEEEEEEEEEDE